MSHGVTRTRGRREAHGRRRRWDGRSTPWTVACALAALACSRGPTPEGGTASGGELFQLCSKCHGEHGEGNRAVKAPAIAGLQSWYVKAQLEKFQKGLRGAHPDDAAGMLMRPMALSLRTEVDVTTIAQYVAGMSPPPVHHALETGDPKRGRKLFEVCKACHGADGAGNEGLKAPRLRRSDDWYLVASLKKFKAGIRGADGRDSTGALMRPNALALPDEQAMSDVAAYIATLD